MAEIDAFAALLIEEAKRFIEIADATDEVSRKNAHLHAALLLGFSALEAHINAVCEEFSSRPELSAHEKALLLEKDVRLKDGEFMLGGLKMYRLEERMTFLHKRFSGKPFDTKAPWWSELQSATKVRNRLTHPKAFQEVTTGGVKNAVRAIIHAIDALYLAIYKKNYPAANRGLDSKLTF